MTRRRVILIVGMVGSAAQGLLLGTIVPGIGVLSPQSVNNYATNLASMHITQSPTATYTDPLSFVEVVLILFAAGVHSVVACSATPQHLGL